MRVERDMRHLVGVRIQGKTVFFFGTVRPCMYPSNIRDDPLVSRSKHPTDLRAARTSLGNGSTPLISKCRTPSHLPPRRRQSPDRPLASTTYGRSRLRALSPRPTSPSELPWAREVLLPQS
jgi:hypothetical protein